MNPIIRGQMFYGDKREEGPLFSIWETTDKVGTKYKASINSHFKGNEHQVLNKQDGFDTVGDAMDWIFGHQNW